MGKPTGFLEYRRAENPCSAPKDRVSDYSDFHFSLPEDQRREQGARCMNCGVPFCQSAFGCPLHNLVPEWNDEIYSGNWSHALSRLTKTNPFPEFTGRVCPALCEHACICGMDDPSAAVTIRENELAVSDYAWAHHFIEPSIPAIRTDKQVAVIGSGPAGLAAADLLNQRGHHVTIYEKDELPGGLLMFGIPAMKLEKSIILRRTEKMQKEGIIFNCNTEIGRDLPAAQLLKQYDAVLLACGARQERTVANADTGIPGVLSALDYLSENTRALLEGRESSKNAKGLDVLVIVNLEAISGSVALSALVSSRVLVTSFHVTL
jgi:glutamate synthase (NADPH/NADH) small chain